MPWRRTARKDLDGDHATAAAWTSRLAGIDGGTGWLALRFWNGEQVTRAGDVVGARAFGEQAIVADAVEAAWQHVDEEAADELGSGEYHDLLALTTFSAIVLPSEGVAPCHTAVARDGRLARPPLRQEKLRRGE